MTRMQQRSRFEAGVAEEIALRHWHEVFGFAWTLVGERARAEDLCQEAYLRFFSMRRSVDTHRSVRPLLFTIVKNLVRSEARRRSVGRLEGDAEEDGIIDPGVLDPSELASRREEFGALRIALETLPESWRAALYLCDGLGLSYREIGEILDKSEDTVRVTLHRARSRIRERLADKIEKGGNP